MLKTDIFTEVTNSIIESIESSHDIGDFKLPWSGMSEMPMNANTNNIYRGVNIITLWCMQMKHNYKSATWATYKHWQELGANVKKGEKSTKIVFWKSIDIESESEKEGEEAEKRMFARWSYVFNADQVEGFNLLDSTNIKNDAETINDIEEFLINTKAYIRRGGQKAYYHVNDDYISMPSIELFNDTKTSAATDSYYAVMLHELTHWTGSSTRLNRVDARKFGDEDYAFEELVAELGSAMLCASLKISVTPRSDHARYISNWLGALKNDNRFIFSAASQAQKAVDYLFP